MTSPLLPSHEQRPADASTPRVIVIGGGLAGMAAAVALESAGAYVTLIEARRYLGGRASSFDDTHSGNMLDTGQHVLLGCCTNLRDFYRRLGISHFIRYERAVHFRDTGGRRYDISAITGVPAPLHLAASIASFTPLSLRQRLAVVRAMTAMLRLSRQQRQQLAHLSFGQWLEQHHQPPATIERFYNPVLIGALNEIPSRVSATYAVQVFQDAMLSHHMGYRVGIPMCPLARLYEHLPCRDVRCGTRVTELCFRQRTLSAIRLHNREMLTADAFILATNRHAVAKLLPDHIRRCDSRFASLDTFEDVPILSAQLWFDRPIMPEMHAALLTGPLQWLFRKDRHGCAVHGVISAARQWLGVPSTHGLQLFEQQIRAVLPQAKNARLERGRIIIEKRATFSPLPEIEQHRPSQAPPEGGIDNLFLAGDYTQTHWPATMEGAVRSGYLAADALLDRLGRGDATRRLFLVDDLPIQWPARLLGHRP